MREKLRSAAKAIGIAFALLFGILFYEANKNEKPISVPLEPASLSIVETKGISHSDLAKIATTFQQSKGILASSITPSYAAITYNPKEWTKVEIMEVFTLKGLYKPVEAKFNAKESKCPVHQWLPIYERILKTISIR